MRFTILLLFTMLTETVFGQQSNKADTVTNQTIIQLHKAGLGKDVLKSKIQTSVCSFNLSTDGLIGLKKAGVPDDVIETMLTKSGTASSPDNGNTENTAAPQLESGIYYQDSATGKYLVIEPSILTNQKSGGLGEALKRSMISGLINAKLRASLSGSQSESSIGSRKPVFLFVFDTTQQGGLSNSNTFLSSVQSPKEFFLVKLTVVKNSREVVVGKTNNVSSDIGVDDKLKVSFTSRKIKKGIYEVIPDVTLLTGEYCFMYAASSMYSGMTHKVYDFSIK